MSGSGGRSIGRALSSGGLEALLGVRCQASFLALSGLSGACGLCLRSRTWRRRASPSEVHHAGKLQWHLTYGFAFMHSLRLPFTTVLPVLKRLIIHVL